MTKRKAQTPIESNADHPRLWRTLEEKSFTPEQWKDLSAKETGVQTTVGRDIDVGTQDLLGRRNFVTLTGAAATMVGLGGCIRRPEERILPYSKAVEHLVPGIPLHFATTLERSGLPLGVLVTSHEGRPTKVEGNARHPSSGGATDAHAQATLLDLYNPDRATTYTQTSRKEPFASMAHSRKAFHEALQTELRAAEPKKGEGLRILVTPTSSPTEVRLRDDVRKRFPKARFHEYSAVDDGPIARGRSMVMPRATHVEVDFSLTHVVAAFDSDFLHMEAGSVTRASNFAKARRVTSAQDAMTRLYSVEAGLSATGAASDNRLRLPSSQVGFALAELIRQLRENHGVTIAPEVVKALPRGQLDRAQLRWIATLAKDFARGENRSVVMVGRKQPDWVHALAHVLHAATGAMPFCVKVHEARAVEVSPDAPPNPGVDGTGDVGTAQRRKASAPSAPVVAARTAGTAVPPAPPGTLAELVSDMERGRVKQLLILHGNPVYDAPADLDFKKALSKVPFTAHLAMTLDETASQCTWHIPAAHQLECWGDALSPDGMFSIRQPLISPLFGGESGIEVLARLSGTLRWQGHRQVRLTAEERWKGTPFEGRWRKTLHSGVDLTESASRAVTSVNPRVEPLVNRLRDVRAMPLPSAGALEVTFSPCSKVWDGRHANNPWLLELPEGMTKICWDNAALMSKSTATELGVQSGDMVQLTEGGRKIELPVWVQPGHADQCVSLTLGWGRSRAGRYGNHVGFDVTPLRTSKHPQVLAGVSLSKTGKTHVLAQTQVHDSMEGRPLSIDMTLDQFRRNPKTPKYKSVEPKLPPLWEKVDYSKGYRWGMNIDLNACTGCNTCVIACQAENNIPSVGKGQVLRGREMYWIRIDRYFVGDDEANPQVALQPVACQQCEQAPCENVCPVNATVHSPEGLNSMVYNRCIGTRYCANNCPYKVRRFNYLAWHGYLDDKRADYTEFPEVKKMQYNPNVTVRFRGVMEKCTYCVQRIEAARVKSKLNKTTIKDGDVVPACAQACPADAIVFGDLNDANSRVSKRANQDRAYKLLVELGTEPRTTFSGRIRNPNPEMKA